MNAEQMTFDQIRAFLDARTVRYYSSGEDRVIQAGFAMPAGRFAVSIHVRGEPTLVFVDVEVPITIPEDRRPQAAETVVRANFGNALGRFELDMSGGHLSFRTSMPAGEEGIGQTQFDCLMNAALWSANRYHRAFGRLVFGDDLSPAEVIAEVEMAA